MATQNWDWIFTTLGWTLAGIGLLLAIWALFWDRSRGTKRCPKCWYSMEGAVEDKNGAVTCPECGRQMPGDRSLHRTRRRMKRAMLGTFVCALGYAVFVTPAVRRGGWVAATPTTALVILASPERIKEIAFDTVYWRATYPKAPSFDYPIENELVRRGEDGSIYSWQADLLAWRLGRARNDAPLESVFKSYDITTMLSPAWWSSPIPFNRDDKAEFFGTISDLLTSHVNFDMWIENGGDEGDLLRMGSRLFVWAPGRDQEQFGLVHTLLTTKGQGDIVSVSAPDWLNQENWPFGDIRMYDVKDLAPPNVTRYKQPPEPWTGPFDGRTDGELILFTGDSMRIITDIVQSEISFDDWIDNGGEKALLVTVPGWLIVTAPPEMHDQIEPLLEKLRGPERSERGTP